MCGMVAVNAFYQCPVCHSEIAKTPSERIAGHVCNNGDDCPASFQAFDIAIKVSIPKMTTRRRERTRLLAELQQLQRRQAEIIRQLSTLDQQ